MARKKWGFGTHKKSDPEIIKPAENVVQETQTSCLTADGIDLEKLPTAKEDEPLYKVNANRFINVKINQIQMQKLLVLLQILESMIFLMNVMVGAS